MKREKPTCIVLERLVDLESENRTLRHRIKILTDTILSGSEEYRHSLKKEEGMKLQRIIGESG